MDCACYCISEWEFSTAARMEVVCWPLRPLQLLRLIDAKVDYETEGLVENIGDMLGVVSARVRGDLKRFKEFIESHSAASTLPIFLIRCIL